jgi:glycosyltransferase involved in cell wall biosynthesis
VSARSGPDAPGPCPRISVVVPTYQRRELVMAAVESLARQTFDQPFEVIVAVDGSTDGTAAALRAMSVPFPLTVVEQPNGGAAAARNHGVRLARGDILLFLDDDMEAAPDLLAEHDRLHRQGADAVLGHMPLHPESGANVISDGVAGWAEERLARLSAPGAALGLHDLLTGQLSVSTETFREINGFDAAFTRAGSFGDEDVDFGHRLLRGGYDVRFNAQAISYQRYVVSPQQHLRQWRETGRADVLFARKHPEEALSLFELNGLNAPFARWVARPVARAPLWAPITGPVRSLAVVAGKRRGRVANQVFFRARALEYWRGVSEAGGIPWRRKLRILAYHAISDLRDAGVLAAYGVPPAEFRRQITTLKARGFHFVSVQEFTAFAEGRVGLPRRAVLITFDDCYDDLLNAASVLLAEGAGALAFAVTGQIGGENAWDRKYGGHALRLLNEAELRRLQERGIEIGAHSRTHRLLPALAAPEIEAEVLGSVNDLAALGLGRARFFAYPYGASDTQVREIAHRAGLVAAFAIHLGVMDADTDRMCIPRVEIRRSDVGALFVTKVLLARQLGWAVTASRQAKAPAHQAARAVKRRLRGVRAMRLRRAARVPRRPSL